MITVISGKLGSGKSYDVHKRAIAHLIAGGVVATNTSLDLASVRKLYMRRVASWQLLRVSADDDPRSIPRGDFRGHGRRRVMIILDEALNWFPSSQGAAADPRKATWGEWLRQSDKLGQDVYFIAQEFSRSAKWIRELAQISDDVRNFGQIRLLGMPVGRWLHLGRVYCVVHADVRTRQRLGVSMGWISPMVWQCYDTAQLFGFSASESAFIADSWPQYRLPGVRLLWLPAVWIALRCIVEGYR